MEESPGIDIVLPACNNPQELQQCLTAIDKQDFRNFEVFLCLDGPGCDRLMPVANMDWNFTLHVLRHPSDRNHGTAATRNLALDYLRNKYALMLDSDLCPAPGALREHLEMLQTNGGISAGHVQYTNANSNLWAFYQQRAGKGKYDHGSQIPFYFFTTQNAALPSYVLKALHGFDVSMVTYGGRDTEFSYRLWKEFKLPFYFNRRALVSGDMNKSLDCAMSQMEEFGRYNFPYILKKHPEFRSLFQYSNYKADNLYGWLLRTLLRKGWANVCWKLVGIMPGMIQESMVRFIAMCYLYAGFRKSGYKD